MIEHPLKTKLKVRLGRNHASIAWTGVGYRSVSSKYATTSDILSGIGSQRAGGRWNPIRSFRAVYVSLDLETGFRESFAHLSYYGFAPHTALPRVFVAIELKMTRLLDLTDTKILQQLRLSRRALLKEDWRKMQDSGQVALTQCLGQLAWETGYEGLVALSAASRRGRNLIFFPDRLLPGSQVDILKPDSL